MKVNTQAVTFGDAPVNLLLEGASTRMYAASLKQFLRTCDATGVRVPQELLHLLTDLESLREDQATRARPFNQCLAGYREEL